MSKTLQKLHGCKKRLDKMHSYYFDNLDELDGGAEKWAERQFESLACHIESLVEELNNQLGADKKEDAMDWLKS